MEASQHDVEARDNGEGGAKRKRTREKENPPVGGIFHYSRLFLTDIRPAFAAYRKQGQ